MRGPLIIDSEKYFDLGEFDVKSFFQGFDDHELFLKAWLEKKYRVGYVPLGFSSPLIVGTARKPRSLKTEISIIFNLIRIRKSRKYTFLYSSIGIDMKNLPVSEIRQFN